MEDAIHNLEVKFRSRKFLLSVAILAVSSIGLFIGKLDGGNFASIAITLSGAYSLSNVLDKKFGGE